MEQVRQRFLRLNQQCFISTAVEIHWHAEEEEEENICFAEREKRVYTNITINYARLPEKALNKPIGWNTRRNCKKIIRKQPTILRNYWQALPKRQ